MKIGLVGAPGSGKTTLGAMLYAELLSAGVEGAYLIHEYAKEWLALGNEFKTFMDQFVVSNQQIHREELASRTSFTPIICDSAVWLGGVYAKLGSPEMTSGVKEYLHRVQENTYDITIFIPLPDLKDQTSEYRVHNPEQALHIENLIKEELKFKRGVIDAPKAFKDRKQFIKELRGNI